MRRRISLLLATLLAGTTLMVFGPVQPASGVAVCAIGAGNVAVTPGLLYPVLLSVLDPALDHTVDILIGEQNWGVSTFSITGIGGAAVCAHVDASPTPTGIVANGTLLGFCGHSTGQGFINGQAFSYVSAGTFLLLTGGVVGLASAIPVPATGSCLHAAVAGTTTFGLPGGATQFIVSGAGVGLNCGSTTPGPGTLVGATTLQLPNPAFGIHTGTIAHVTTSTCNNPQPLLP